jgi:hypothetical protein
VAARPTSGAGEDLAAAGNDREERRREQGLPGHGQGSDRGCLGDAKLQAEGKADQAEGKLQNAVGGLKDAILKA